MQKLNAVLAESASRERQGPLKGEVSDIDKRLQNVSVRLNAKLADLEGTIAKWSDYYKRLNNFSDWLNQKESSLNQVYEEKKDLPEEQLSKAEVRENDRILYWKHLVFTWMCESWALNFSVKKACKV